MRPKILEDFDRLDPNLKGAVEPEHTIVLDRMRGALNLDRDVSQHRRYTAMYGDLQN